jgi:hypothetical protein
MEKTLLMILLIVTQTAYSQKTRRSDSKAEKKPMTLPLRADIFGECYEDQYLDNEDGTTDTFSVPNWKRPDCIGMEIKKPVYRNTRKRNTSSKEKNPVKPPKRRPVIEMLTMTVRKLEYRSPPTS